ncbi:MAG TPA: hypothetical protein VJP86_10055 [Vicinamibacterales bacterium]|nr:hypothetical protein [Vicinamibacterales bacterium]
MTHDDAMRTLAAERYLLEEMSETERDAFEDHYFGCPICAEDVREGALLQEGVRNGLLAGRRMAAAERHADGGRVLTLPPRRRSWYQSAVIPWAAAATLALIAGYQSLVLLPGARGNLGPRALYAISLRPASRGAEPRVAIGRELMFALEASSAFDTPPASSANLPGELSYDLRTAAGTGVISGRVQAPAPGSPLLLFIPAGVIREPGHYVLTVSGAEYRFEAVR